MPIQINEIIIKANIIEGAQEETKPDPFNHTDINKEEIIRECTEQVLEIINSQNKR